MKTKKLKKEVDKTIKYLCKEIRNDNSNISDPQPAPAENPQTEPQQMNAAEAALFGSFK